MKVRAGFVSNSSSSSFIVAVDKPDAEVTITIKFKVDFSKYAENSFSSEKELMKFFKEEGDYYGISDEQFERMLNAVQRGKTVHYGSFSDQDEFEERILCEQGIPKDTPGIEVIESEGGY